MKVVYMDDLVTIRLNRSRMEFLLKVFEYALQYDELDDEECERLKLWESWFKYLMEFNEMCVKDR